MDITSEIESLTNLISSKGLEKDVLEHYADVSKEIFEKIGFNYSISACKEGAEGTIFFASGSDEIDKEVHHVLNHMLEVNTILIQEIFEKDFDPDRVNKFKEDYQKLFDVLVMIKLDSLTIEEKFKLIKRAHERDGENE